MTESLRDRGLPKWPQMYVTGVPVTVEQAKEIIRRTDTFFSLGYGGNNRQYDAWVRETLDMPPSPFGLPFDADGVAARQAAREKEIAFEARWNPLRTSYVHNSWVSSSFIGGPHGWCHPDGAIGFVDNVGKWPSVSDIEEAWAALAAAFPFIDVAVTLYDREATEEGNEPVVSMVIKGGKVELLDPTTVDVHATHSPASRRAGGSSTSAAEEFMAQFHNPRREQGLPDSWILEWAAV